MAEKIKRIQRNFLWSRIEEKNKLSLVNWEQVCKPKGKGGLGIRRMKDLNKSLLTKIGWRLAEGNTGWENTMKAKYLSNTSFRWNLYNNDLLGGSKIGRTL